MTEAIQREMTISLKDFFRILPIALRSLEYQCEQDFIRVHYQAGQVIIRPGAEKQRKIASLTLPVLKVDFMFQGLSAEQITQFLDNFRRSYQRGGG